MISSTFLSILILCCCVVLHIPAKTVTSPPRFTNVSKKEIAYKVGERVELPCNAQSDPEPTYEWRKDGEPLDITSPDFQREPGTGTIIIPEPMSRHEGIYQCFAKNMYGTAVGLKTMLKKATLEPFPAMREPKVHHPTIGEPLVLRCNPPFSYPKGIVYWAEVKPGAKISAIDNSSRVSHDFEGNLYFTNVEGKDRTDGDGYVCIVNNEFLHSLSKGDEENIYPVSSPEPPQIMRPSVMWTPQPMTVAVKGENLHLKCIFAGYPTPTVKWRRLDAPMPPKVNHTSFGQEIVITKIDENDSGMYECSATQPGLAEPLRKAFIVRVESMPFWMDAPEDVNSSEEEDAEFHCKAGGVPNPDIKWSINGIPIEELPHDPRRTVTKHSVTYHNLKKTDAQVLQCNATNKHGYIFANAFLNVLAAEPPSFIQGPESVKKAAQKQDVSLKCRTFGAPKPVITWTKDGQTIDDVHRIHVKKNGDLKIKGVIAEDRGIYKCHARNKLGEIEAHGELIVREATQIVPGILKDKEVNATAKVEFSCQATTDPAEQSKLRIEWKRNGQVIDYEQEGRISKNMADNSLTISQAMVSDSAAYTCVASNGFDSDEFTVQLTVKDRPDPPTNVTLNSCSTTRAEISWDAGSDNNDAVQEFIVYYNTSFDKPGQYHEAKARILSANEREINLSPWASYTFHVRARNNIGMSARSHLTTTICRTPPSAPSQNPRGLCAESRNANNLVLVWEPMPEIEHNGPGFTCEIKYQPRNGEEKATVVKVSDWHQRELVVKDVGTYKQFIVSIVAFNDNGRSHAALDTRTVYSGEDTPLDQPGNFLMDESTLNATSAKFTWDPVDKSSDRVRGFFRGYQIQFWQSDDPENIRSHDVILENYDPCPSFITSQFRRKRNVSQESTHAMNLWPFSRITAGVLVLNGAKKGALGETIEFTTPEGIPGAVPSLKVMGKGSHHFKVKWHSPYEPNGIITGYIVGIKRGTGFNPVKEKKIMDPLRTTTKLRRLEPDTQYTIFVWALTSKGRGDVFFIESRTLEASEPDVPGFANIEAGENYINVTWVPTAEGPIVNPGSEFFVEYRPAGSSDDEPWKQTRLETEHNWVNITNLTPGETYEIRVVAVNGGGETTRSTPKIVRIGPSEAPVGLPIAIIAGSAAAGVVVLIPLIIGIHLCRRYAENKDNALEMSDSKMEHMRRHGQHHAVSSTEVNDGSKQYESFTEGHTKDVSPHQGTYATIETTGETTVQSTQEEDIYDDIDAN